MILLPHGVLDKVNNVSVVACQLLSDVHASVFTVAGREARCHIVVDTPTTMTVAAIAAHLIHGTHNECAAAGG
jgi:hypothetical protein